MDILQQLLGQNVNRKKGKKTIVCWVPLSSSVPAGLSLQSKATQALKEISWTPSSLEWLLASYSCPRPGFSCFLINLSNINNLRYVDDTALMAGSEEELKSLLMKAKEESEKVGINSTFRKLRSWHPVLSLHGKQMGKQWLSLFFWAPKSLRMVTARMKLKDRGKDLGGKL